jgi:hypothetical protein
LNVVVVKDKIRSIIELPKKEKKKKKASPAHPPKAIMNKNCLDENKQTSKQVSHGVHGVGEGGRGGVLGCPSSN